MNIKIKFWKLLKIAYSLSLPDDTVKSTYINTEITDDDAKSLAMAYLNSSPELVDTNGERYFNVYLNYVLGRSIKLSILVYYDKCKLNSLDNGWLDHSYDQLNKLRDELSQYLIE